ncbi:hypothetical protein AMTR_s00081p00164930 [Amborella trichopoda]|uniref:Uncharacterized protein n=1 Tax=Amborella trichopoda TaxID=13333 RepID=W1PA19_AMBTC|nr:hypothetical protein AMTR_s00081p00164930 [Amborella trichopoda]
MSFVGVGIRTPGLAMCPSNAFVGGDVRLHKDTDNGLVLDGEPVAPDLRGLFEILKTNSQAVHKILKVIRPKLNLVHQKMMRGCGGPCWLVISVMVVGQMNDLDNFNVQRLGELLIC